MRVLLAEDDARLSAVLAQGLAEAVPLKVDEEQTATLAFPTPVPAGEPEVTFTFHVTTGVGPSKPVTLEMPS